MRNTTTWACLVAKTMAELVVSLLLGSLVGRASQSAAMQSGQTGKSICIPMCPRVGARGGRRRAGGSGEQRQEGEGVKRRRQDMFSKLPLMCQKAYKAAFRLAKPTKSVGTVDWCVDGPRIPSLVGDHNRTSTPRTRLRTHQRYRKRQ